MDENKGLELTEENVDTVLDEIRCAGAAGGGRQRGCFSTDGRAQSIGWPAQPVSSLPLALPLCLLPLDLNLAPLPHPAVPPPTAHLPLPLLLLLLQALPRGHRGRRAGAGGAGWPHRQGADHRARGQRKRRQRKPHHR